MIIDMIQCPSCTYYRPADWTQCSCGETNAVRPNVTVTNIQALVEKIRSA